MAIAGGLATPAGIGAMAPTLGTMIHVSGASGFAAAASAAGTVAFAASFGAGLNWKQNGELGVWMSLNSKL